MILSRDFVAYMARELVKRLTAAQMFETRAPEALIERIRLALVEELSLEDRVNEEVRQILSQYSDEMRRSGVSYQEMFKKVKSQIARERKLILR
jgi:hypothetical protein